MPTVLYMLMIFTPFITVTGLASAYVARKERERKTRWESVVKATDLRDSSVEPSAQR